MKFQRKSRRLSFETLQKREVLAAEWELVSESPDAAPLTRFAATESSLFFVRDDPRYGSELWRADADGTNASLVKDIRPGVEGSQIQDLAVIGEVVYFAADNGVSGLELWKSGGTSATTQLVADIFPGSEGGYRSQKLNTIPGNISTASKLFFSAQSEPDKAQLWTSDGTATGTRAVSLSFDVSSVSGLDRADVNQAILVDDRVVFTQSFFSEVTGERKNLLFITNSLLSTAQPIEQSIIYSNGLENVGKIRVGTVVALPTSDYSSRYFILHDDSTVTKLLPEGSRAINVSISPDGFVYLLAQEQSGAYRLYQTDGTLSGMKSFDLPYQLNGPILAVNDKTVVMNYTLRNPFVLLTATVTLPPGSDMEIRVEPLDFLPSTNNLTRELIDDNRYWQTSFNDGNQYSLRIIDLMKREAKTLLVANANESIVEVVRSAETYYVSLTTVNSSRLVRINAVTGVQEVLATQNRSNLNSGRLRVDGNKVFYYQVDSDAAEWWLIKDSAATPTTVAIAQAFDFASLYNRDQFPTSYSPPRYTSDGRSVAFVYAPAGGAFAISKPYSSVIESLVPVTQSQVYNFDIVADRILFLAGSIVDGKQVLRLLSMGFDGSQQGILDVPYVGRFFDLDSLGVFDGRAYFSVFKSDSWSIVRTNASGLSVETYIEGIAGPDAFRLIAIFQDAGTLNVSNEATRLFVRSVTNSEKSIAVNEIFTSADSIAGRVNRLYDFPTSDDPLASAPRYAFVRGSGLLVTFDFTTEPLIERRSTGTFQRFFGTGSPPSPTAQLTSDNLVRIDNSWIARVIDPVNGDSIWQLDDSQVSPVLLKQFSTINPLNYWRPPLLINGKMALIAEGGQSGNTWSVTVDSGQVTLLRDRATGLPLNGYPFALLVRNGVNTLPRRILLAGSSLYELDPVEPLGDFIAKLPQQARLDVDRTGATEPILATETRQGITSVWELRESIAPVIPPATDNQFTFSTTDQSWQIKSEGTWTQNVPFASTPAYSFNADDRNVEFTINFGDGSQAAIPRDGLDLSLGAGSILKLVGSPAGPVDYAIGDDQLVITINGRAVRIRLKGPITIDDQLATSERKISGSYGNDQLQLLNDSSGRPVLMDLGHSLSIIFPMAPAAEGESLTSKLSINTRSGFDTLRLQNDFHGIGLVDVVSELDANSKLSFVSKQVSAPVMTQRVNGRTVATSQVDGVTVQIDLTNRPQHNAFLPGDADNDGVVRAIDALRIVNFLALRTRDPMSSRAPKFADVSGDSRITALDALQIINFIARSRRPGAGESATSSLPMDSIRSTAQAHGLEVPVELATIF